MSRRFTEAEIAEVWERVQAGELTRSIARRLVNRTEFIGDWFV